MSLDVMLTKIQPTTIYRSNITHNLGDMARVAGLYDYLWHPEDHEITKAAQLIQPLREGLERLRNKPDFFERFNPKNGWGTYKSFVQFVELYLKACQEDPDAAVKVSR